MHMKILQKVWGSVSCAIFGIKYSILQSVVKNDEKAVMGSESLPPLVDKIDLLNTRTAIFLNICGYRKSSQVGFRIEINKKFLFSSDINIFASRLWCQRSQVHQCQQNRNRSRNIVNSFRLTLVRMAGGHLDQANLKIIFPNQYSYTSLYIFFLHFL